ncbi:hypothetical protein PIB30_105174, partial [Stylosanthes scabra]|nr:hypothetical protein [Stylosanthes scabra]
EAHNTIEDLNIDRGGTSLKPLLNRRGTWRRYLILPVPVVFLRIAFMLQLSDLGFTLSLACGGESAGGATSLLKVEAAVAAPHT